MTPEERAEFIADVAAAIRVAPASLTDDEQRWVRECSGKPRTWSVLPGRGD